VVSIRDFSSNPRDHLDPDEERALLLTRKKDEKQIVLFLLLSSLVISSVFTIYTQWINPVVVVTTEPIADYSINCARSSKNWSLSARAMESVYEIQLNQNQCDLLRRSTHDHVVVDHRRDSVDVQGYRVFDGSKLMLEDKGMGPITRFLVTLFGGFFTIFFLLLTLAGAGMRIDRSS